ncbi:MAG: DUF4465 domain-containing protein [Bacteroidales bacterium]|jgi:hypothetical protein|nr:DUF4465 domain-containing protein [Bacteroidales bacterium]
MTKKLLSIVAILMFATNVFCQTATFEDFELANESHYQGDESLDGFTSGTFFFGNSFTEEWDYWEGFAVSNHTTKEFDPDNNIEGQFYNVVGSGYKDSKNFGVVYPPYGGLSMVTMPENSSMQVKGVYVTNSAWTYYTMLNGDTYMGDPFGQGDWYKIIATGENSEGETTTTEFYLADFRSDNPNEHYIIEEWTWFDLSVLGEIVNVGFDLDASRKNEYGLTITSYFCIDDFNGTGNAGINNFDLTTDIIVYPNPVSDYVNIDFENNSDITVKNIRLYNINGEVLESVIPSEFCIINMEKYKSGIYFIEIKGNDFRKVKKIIKL